ncbi:hypothetical protein ID866_10955 [Astraeus odoratus]|nr:hypothetical protein ID866_10955 [Astraeus odoratus]
MATSVRDFWSHRWHQLARRTFIFLGGWPLSAVFGRTGYILGSFLVSGIYHHIIILALNGGVEIWCMPVSFGMMGVGVILEHWFSLLTGRKVGGWVGWLWTVGWVLGWGNMMVDGFARAGMLGCSRPFDILVASPVKDTVERHVMAFDSWLHTYASGV